MAFVLETEAHLEGTRAMRSEMAGIGTDSDALANRLGQMSTKSKAAFDSMTSAEKQAYLAFVGLSEGATVATKALEGEAVAAARAGQATGAAAQTTARSNTVAAQSFDPISSRARTAANAFAMLGLAASGGTGSVQSMVTASGSLAFGLASLSTSARIAAGASGIGAMVTVAAVLIPLLMRMGRESERVAGSFGKAFGGGDDASAGRFLELARQRRAAAQKALEDAPTGLLNDPSDRARKERQAALDEAVKDEQSAIEAVFAARRNARRRAAEERKQEQEDIKRDRARTDDIYFAVTNERILAEMRGSGNAEGADVQQARIDRTNRDLEISDLKISDAEKEDLRTRNADALEAKLTEIHNKYADQRIAKADDEARKQEDIDKRKAAKRLDIAKQNVHALVTAEGSILQTMKRLALEPIIDRLEGIAAQQAVEAVASGAALDFRGAAMHAAAAAAAIAAAREVAGWAGTGGRGGGGSAGAGAGSGGGPGTFEPVFD
jgi:hypothetical protein